MYNTPAVVRLIAYSLGAAVCGALALFGVIDPSQIDPILTNIGTGVGVLVSVLAALHVTKVDDPATTAASHAAAPATPATDAPASVVPATAAPDDPPTPDSGTVGAFQLRG
ncbi:hypothetical protein [Nocardia terpenica]|uniref:hypothetical protein n=1 Tax=Nocardia terpenica TaxID=455432 RepID=UPI0012FDCC4F|nr:hypothetical protein [Nocardia terpenica]